jgi:RNA polymerase sigma factor (sigma-70 family)
VSASERPLSFSDSSGSVTATISEPIERETLVPPDASQQALDPDQASLAALVRSAADGEQRAWQELVSRFGGLIASVGWRYGLGMADVNELQQTTWLRLVESIDRIRQPERVGGWLVTTARRESLQILRRGARYETGAETLLSMLPNADEPDPDAGPVADEQAVAVRAAWSRLKPRCQEMLSLLITHEAVAYRDLSALLNMPIGSIGPTRARCLEHLRRLVAEEGVVGL